MNQNDLKYNKNKSEVNGLHLQFLGTQPDTSQSYSVAGRPCIQFIADTNTALVTESHKTVNVRSTYIAPHLRMPPSAQTGPPFSQGRSRPSPHTRTFDLCRHTAAHSPGLPFKWATSIIHVNTWITTHLPIPEGWKAE